MAAILILLMILGLGAAALLGRTPDSRDPEYGFGRLIGHTRTPAESADEVEPAVAVALTVPAAWQTEHDDQQRRSGVESLG